MFKAVSEMHFTNLLPSRVYLLSEAFKRFMGLHDFSTFVCGCGDVVICANWFVLGVCGKIVVNVKPCVMCNNWCGMCVCGNVVNVKSCANWVRGSS